MPLAAQAAAATACWCCRAANSAAVAMAAGSTQPGKGVWGPNMGQAGMGGPTARPPGPAGGGLLGRTLGKAGACMLPMPPCPPAVPAPPLSALPMASISTSPSTRREPGGSCKGGSGRGQRRSRECGECKGESAPGATGAEALDASQVVGHTWVQTGGGVIMRQTPSKAANAHPNQRLRRIRWAAATAAGTCCPRGGGSAEAAPAGVAGAAGHTAAAQRCHAGVQQLRLDGLHLQRVLRVQRLLGWRPAEGRGSRCRSCRERGGRAGLGRGAQGNVLQGDGCRPGTSTDGSLRFSVVCSALMS